MTAQPVRIPTIDTDLFPLNLGGNVFGWKADEARSFAVLDAFVAAGGNFVDTADVYSNWVPGNTGGDSEKVLGAWFAARGNRSDVVLATKAGALEPHKGLSREAVRAALSDSLERLGTDYVDLYYAHFDDGVTAPEELARTFSELVDEGRIRAIGMSNLSPERQRAWLAAAEAEGLHAPVAIQPEYNLVARHDFETGYAPLAAKHGLAVFPYFSLAAGFLTGKFRSPEDLDEAQAAKFAKSATPAGFAVVSALNEIAEELGTAATAVALAWLRSRRITAPLASARDTAQLTEILAGAELELSEDHLELLTRLSAAFA